MSAELFFKHKKFSPLLWTQFFGALNDNFFKNALVVLVTYKGVSLWGFESSSLVALASGIFILPFFFFSPISGQLADKFEKSHMARIVKWAEVAIMLIASFGSYTHHFSLLMVALFFMGLHSTFFGPIKYSIIPELLPENKLTAGNAYVEVGTFLAILIGTIAGGVAAALPAGESFIIGGLLAIAILGLIMSQFIPPVPLADANIELAYNPLPQIGHFMKLPQKNKTVFNSILGISWFWFFGAAILSILPVLTKDLLMAGEHVVTLFLAVFTIGIAIGAVACEKLSYDRVEIGLVPWGSLGMTLFLADFAWAASLWAPGTQHDSLISAAEFVHMSGSLRIIFDLLMVAIFGGLFTVPLYTLMQERSDRRNRSQVIASNNIYNALFMVTSSVLLMGFYALKLSLPQIILIYAALNLLVSFYIYSIVPEFTLRFLSWVLARLVYRIRVQGLENIPREGAALLVCNHVSFVDWLILAAAIKRPVRFVMYYKFAEIPLAKYLFRHAQVIPIAGVQENKKIFDAAFDQVSRELKAGELVCIFPEGAITHDGEIQTFKRGIEYILKRDAVPVVPMALVGLWGSIFSRKDGGAFTKMPRRIWFHVDVKIAPAVPATQATAEALEAKVRSL